MKKVIVLAIIATVFLSCDDTDKTQSSNDQKDQVAMVKDGVFLHISEGYNDPHKVLMPMKMAVMMAEDKDVLIYMDIHAVELMVKDANDLTYDGFDSFQTYLEALLAEGVGIYACPTCLQVAGYTPEDLKEGIQVANKEKFFNFTEGRILSLDY